MKWFKFFIGSILLCFFASTTLSAQTAMASQLGAYVQSQNYTAIQAVFANEVNVNFNAREQKVSKAAAMQKLKTFLAEIKPSAFSSKHNGKSENDKQFYTGTLKTEAGNFDVYFLVKDSKIIELCIEE